MVKIGDDIQLRDFPLLLAPMEDVSDPPFRVLCKEQGADMMYTEFVSSEGLIRDAWKTRKKLDIFDYERPIGIQIFGGDIESMIEATQIAETVDPDVIDINYGCPVRKVVSKGAGAGILKDVPKMVRLTDAIVKTTKLPVTVKTRLGWDEDSMHIEEVAEQLQDVGIQALTIHGRTRKQMYKGKSNWELIRKIKTNPRIHIPIFGNGDVATPQQAMEAKIRYNVDGIMMGRATIGNPWIFREIRHFLETGEILAPPTVEERVDACRKHLSRSIQWKGEVTGILEMRRHYFNYLRGLPNIKGYRKTLVTSKDKEILYQTFEEIVGAYDGYVPEDSPMIPRMAK